MEFMTYVKIIGGAAAISLLLAVMNALAPNRRLWLSEEQLERRRSPRHILVTWVIMWVVLSFCGIYLVHYIGSLAA